MYCRYAWGEYLASEERGTDRRVVVVPGYGTATAATTRGDDEVRKGREPDNAAGTPGNQGPPPRVALRNVS